MVRMVSSAGHVEYSGQLVAIVGSVSRNIKRSGTIMKFEKHSKDAIDHPL